MTVQPFSATAQVKSLSGTAAKPGVTFTGDEDTGLYRPGANELAVTVGGAEAAKFTATGMEIDGDISLDDGGTYTTTLQTITPTAARTISFPDATGTVALVGGSSGNLVVNQSGAYAGVANSSVDNATGNITLGSRFISSLNGAASAPPGTFTGTWYTGGTATTTKPQVLIEPTGTTSTAWSTGGTGLGVNAASGFAGRLLDLQTNGTSNFNVDSTGRVSFPLGLAATPSLYPGTDTNTGIYSPGADQVAVATNGIGRLTITSSKTTIENNFLEVKGAAPNITFFETDNTDNNPKIRVTGGDTIFELRTDEDVLQRETLRITSAGLVGIGTSSPAYKLDVSTIVFGANQSGGVRFGSSDNNSTRILQKVTAGGIPYSEIAGNKDGNGWLAFTTGSSDTERLRITSTGRVGIGTTSPSSALEINAAAATSPFIAKINTAEVARIDSSGRLLVGTSTARSNDGVTPRYFQEGSLYQAFGICSNGGTTPNGGASIFLSRSRGTTLGSSTIVAAGDTLGSINFYGADGTDINTAAAYIAAQVDGTPGANNMPGRLVFSTTADGTSSPTERMRIDSSGRIGINGEYNLSAANRISIDPNEGTIGFGGDGREEYITGNAGCYIYSGSGPSGTTLSGELVLQSRSNIDRPITFVTGSTPTKRMEIAGNGYVRLAAGTGGIQFNGDTAAANALDDYEEGTFSPVPTNFTSPLLIQSNYTKIGRRVFVEFYWAINSANAPYTYNPTDIADWTGLPFSAATTWAINGIAVSLASTNSSWAAFGPPGSSHKEFIVVGERGGSRSIRLLNRSTGAFATWGDLILPTGAGTSPGVRASFSYEAA